MNINIAALKALLAFILFLISSLVGVLCLAMARHDGNRWTSSIRQGGTGFLAAGTLLTGLYVAFISIP
jgi:hypothetical protein